MNARPGPLEGLVLFTVGVAVIALAFVIQAEGLSGVTRMAAHVFETSASAEAASEADAPRG